MANDFPPDTSAPVTPGTIVLYNECRPPLPAGDYNLGVDHVLLIGTETRHFSESTHPFTITGPRLNLDPNEIHATYPPANSEGQFATRLPLVVLRRRTLPWERSLVPGDTSADAIPWLVLLLFEEGEITLLDPPNCTVGRVLAPDPSDASDPDPELVAQVRPAPDSLLDDLTDDERDQKCLGIQVPLHIFQAVVPMRDEIPLLTHVRQVSTEDKELLGMDKDGWFAVVVGNRLPLGSIGEEPGRKYHACLVSLEGREDIIPDAQAVMMRFNEDPYPDTGEYVRLVTLARWEFKCKGEGDFQSLMEAIPRRGGVALLGMSPQEAVLPNVVPKTSYRVALDSGHVPLPHGTRHGEASVAWYRGPLVPVGVQRERLGPYHTADQARRIDPLTGLENLGYAAAFEIGRLLALSDPHFALELLRWRRGDYDRVATKTMLQFSPAWTWFAPAQWETILHLQELMVIAKLMGHMRAMLDDPFFGLIDPLDIGPRPDPLIGLKPEMVSQAWGLELGLAQSFFGEDMVRDASVLAIVADTFEGPTEFDAVVQAYGQITMQRNNWVTQGYTMSTVQDRTGFEFLRDQLFMWIPGGGS